MARHRILFEGFDPAANGSGTRLLIGGEEGHHAARVKRCEAGHVIELLNGRGSRADATIAAIRKSRQGEWELELEIGSITQLESPQPRVEVFAAAAKGDRLEEMIDGLSQVGADLYRPLIALRTVVDPRAGKINRLRRVAAESVKQCGRAWGMQIGDPVTFADAIASHPPGTVVLAADATGAALPVDRIAGAQRVVLLVGPEGGFSPEEFSQFRRADVTLCKLGTHVLRVETAAVVGAAMIRSLFPT